MKPLIPALALVFVLVLALVGCATPSHGPHAPGADGARRDDGMGGSMMDEMCQRHATEPGRAASAPDGMMDRHCKARADAPAGAASHVH